MDRDEPFTFETANSGPASDVAGDTAQRNGTGENPTGRIDPAIARATAGGDTSEPVTTSEPAPAASAPGGGTPASTPGPKKRGRPALSEAERAARQTSGVASSGDSKNIRVSFIEKTLMGIHLGLAAITKVEELEIGKDDARVLAEATAGVLALYKVRMTAKQEAYGLLIEAIGQVYVPMGVSIYMRKKMEAASKPQPRPQPVTRQTAQPGSATVMQPVPQPGRDFVQPGADAYQGSPLQQEISDVAPKGEMPDGFDPGNIVMPKG